MKIEILNADEFRDIYNNLYCNVEKFDLKDKIHYFSYRDFSTYGGGNKHQDSLRFFVAYNDKDILGVCKFAYWESSKTYAVSYLSTNKDYMNQGISKKILDVLFDYFSKTYPTETMHWSGYSIQGWLYLRPSIKKMSNKYNVKIVDKAIEYITEWNDENRNLFDESRKIIMSEYNLEYYF